MRGLRRSRRSATDPRRVSTDLILLIAGAATAGFVQGVSGFGFSMVALSFWVWGFEPRTAAVMAVFGALSGQVLSAFTVRRALSVETLLALSRRGCPGHSTFGVWALPHLDPAVFRLTVGVILLVCCPAMLLASRFPTVQHGGRAADAHGRRGGWRHGRAGRLQRRGTVAVVHAAGLRQRPAAQCDPELQPRGAVGDDGQLPRHGRRHGGRCCRSSRSCCQRW